MINLELVLPEIFLSLSIMFLLILGVFKKNSSRLIQNISLIVLLITSVITLNETLGIEETLLFNSSIIIDYLSSKKIEIDNIDFLKNMSAKEKKELLINIEKN